MNRNLVVTALTLVLIVSVIVILKQRGEIVRLGQAIERAETERKVAATPTIVRETPRERKTKPVPATPELVPPVASMPPTNRPSRGMLANMGAMMKDPAMRDVMRSQQKVALEMIYGDLFKELNLPPEQLDALKDLLADRQMANMDAGFAMMTGETSAEERAQKAKELEQIKGSFDKKIEEFLGANDYAVFKQYEETQTERMQVRQFKQLLPSAEPLTSEQEQELIQVMYEERKNMPNPFPGSNPPTDPKQFTEEKMAETIKVWEQSQAKYLERAATILSPTQLEQFKKSQEQQRALMQMGIKMASQMFGEEKKTPPPPVTPQP